MQSVDDFHYPVSVHKNVGGVYTQAHLVYCVRSKVCM